MKKTLARLEHHEDTWFLIGTLFVFFLLRLPSLFEPYWYGDEGIYEVIGIALRQGRLLYQGIWDNKPPLLYLIYALFTGDQFMARLASLFFGLGAVATFFFLVKKLCDKKKHTTLVTHVSTGLFTLFFGLPILEGNIANAENFMLFPIIAAALLVVTYVKRPQTTPKQTFFLLGTSGLLLGLAFLIKVVAVFDFATFSLFIIFLQLKGWASIKKLFFAFLPFVAGFFLPLVITLLYFVSQHAAATFIHSAFLSNVGYVDYGNKFIIPQGLLILKLFVLGGICGILFWKRKAISPIYLFTFLWLSFSIFNALFSQRPYTHYMLVVIASFSLFVGLLFFFHQEKRIQISLGIVACLIVAFFYTNFWHYDNPIAYYANFISFYSGSKSLGQYQSFFDKVTPRDYEIAQYITVHKKPGDTIFVWGNSGQIYALTQTIPAGRYIVAYWIGSTKQTLTETYLALQKNSPTFIIVLPNTGSFPYPLVGYRQTININGASIYERIL